jgi:hypothetical protein
MVGPWLLRNRRFGSKAGATRDRQAGRRSAGWPFCCARPLNLAGLPWRLYTLSVPKETERGWHIMTLQGIWAQVAPLSARGL